MIALIVSSGERKSHPRWDLRALINSSTLGANMIGIGHTGSKHIYKLV